METSMDRQALFDHLTRTPLEVLMARADAVRVRHVGEAVHVRGIIEFSNHCVRNCLYCGVRRDNKTIERYRMAPNEVIELALKVAASGVPTLVLQSGDDFAYAAPDIAAMVREIKRRAEVAVTLAVGERPFADYEQWREAGADRYLLKHETASEELYVLLHPGQRLESRLKAWRHLRSLGYEVGTGMIVGLPGQTPDDLAADLLLTEELQPDMCGIGPFIPQADTPLAHTPPGDFAMTLRMLALARLACPAVNLPATTALATLNPADGHFLAFRAGANVIMPSFTPPDYRRHYRIYDHKANITMEQVLMEIARAGRKPARPQGGVHRAHRS